MNKRLISYEPLTGVAAWHEYDSVTKESHLIHTYDDCAPVLEQNKVLYNHVDGYRDSEKTMKHVASIPPQIYTKWLLEEGIDVFNKDHWPRVQAKLNDSEWRYLRTSPGRI